MQPTNYEFSFGISSKYTHTKLQVEEAGKCLVKAKNTPSNGRIENEKALHTMILHHNTL